MDFNEYQSKAWATAVYPDIGSNLWYPTLGLNGEAGEVAEKVKKVYRDSDGVVATDVKVALVKELGDVLWYVAGLASELQVSLDDVAKMNIGKLEGRAGAGKLHGSGDNR